MPKVRNVSRRSLLGRIGIAAVTVLSAVPIGSSFGMGTIPQLRARYQDSPKGDRQCSRCANFVAPSSCKLVAGAISPQGWCLFYNEKS